MCIAFVNAKATHIFSAKILKVYAIFNDQKFYDALPNNIVSFEQLGPSLCSPFIHSVVPNRSVDKEGKGLSD